MFEGQEITVDTFINDHDNKVFEEDIEDNSTEPTMEGRKPEYTFGGPDFRTTKAKRAENEAIDSFQKTGDVRILEEVYKNRIPTLKWWANKNKYLDDNSFDDVLGELTKIFVRAVYGYNYTINKKDKNGVIKRVKKQFNNYLYSSLENSMCNLHNRKWAKKRTTEEMEKNSENVNYMSSILLSLNYPYNNGDSEYTLQDIIPDQRFGMDGKIVDNIAYNETISVLCSQDDPTYIKEAFLKLGEGSSLASVLREYRQVTGQMRITPTIAKKLRRRKCTRIVSDMICEKHRHKDFTLVDYEVKKKSLVYTIELDNTEETDSIIKKIRRLRKNKESVLKKINIV